MQPLVMIVSTLKSKPNYRINELLWLVKWQNNDRVMEIAIVVASTF